MDLLPFLGIGLRLPHYQQVLETKPDIDWLEVHSENFFMKGGASIKALLSIRESYPISLHGIGLSLGSIDGIQFEHLHRLKELINIVDPFLVSEHLSWSHVNKVFLPDLLPVPYTEESLQVFCDNIRKTQDFLQREILIENPSSYLEYSISAYHERDFLVNIARKTGAKLLVDINNIFVSCSNHNWNADEYIKNIPPPLVGEIHLAGHTTKQLDNNEIILIDTHDNFICPEVWDLYAKAVKHFGKCPTLLEWDANIPDLGILIREANKTYNYCPQEIKNQCLA